VASPLVTLANLRRLIVQRLAHRRLRQRLRAAPLWTLADLPEDTWARITGVARPLGGRVLEAPLSGRLCLYYSVAVEEVRAGGSITVLAGEQEGLPFVLEDRGGRAVIDPAHARISTAFDHVTESRALFDAGPRERALLERYELVHRDWFQIDSLRYCEAIIEVDEPLTVVGSGTREPDPEAPAGGGAYRDDRPTRIRLTGSARYPLMISDDPRPP
jgi:hypothetical protein